MVAERIIIQKSLFVKISEVFYIENVDMSSVK